MIKTVLNLGALLQFHCLLSRDCSKRRLPGTFQVHEWYCLSYLLLVGMISLGIIRKNVLINVDIMVEKSDKMIFRGAGVNIVRGVAGAGVLTSFDRWQQYHIASNCVFLNGAHFIETITLTFHQQGEGVLHQQETTYLTYAEKKLSNCHIVVIRAQHFWFVVQLWHLKTSHIALLVTCRDRRADQPTPVVIFKTKCAVSDSRHFHCNA